MARENLGTNVEPGVVQRISGAVKYVISGVNPAESFFGPSQPIAPIAQDKVEGRGWDFPVGFNLRITPKQGEGTTWNQLRALADNYDLLRTCIETRKDQLEAYEWEIVPKDEDASLDKYQSQIDDVTGFLESPDQEHTWSEWLRMVVEDMLVIDAVCIYPRMNRGGKLYGFELIDGATINRLLDDEGRTPLPPSPAYQQIIKGIPAADYSLDQLSYWARNRRTWRVYGYSPVEQVLMTVNIALRRQMSQLEFYTAGNVPEALAAVPDTWTPKQISDFQLWWDSIMEGQTAQRRKMRFMPALKDIAFPKKDLLKDEFDEWLARIICYAFSLPPTPFIKQQNRATAESAADSAKEEGAIPTLRWIEAKMTVLINKYLGAKDLKFSWKMAQAIDPASQTTILTQQVTSEIITPDEAREELGKAPLTPEQRAAAFPMPAAFEPTLGPDRKPNAVGGGMGDSSPESAVEPKAEKTNEPKVKESA